MRLIDNFSVNDFTWIRELVTPSNETKALRLGSSYANNSTPDVNVFSPSAGSRAPKFD